MTDYDWAGDIDKLKQLNGALCAEVNAKDARIRELESSLNYVADRWAESQISAEDYAKRCRLLESLVRDMWRTLSAMYQLNLGIDIGKEHDYEQRIVALGIEVNG